MSRAFCTAPAVSKRVDYRFSKRSSQCYYVLRASPLFGFRVALTLGPWDYSRLSGVTQLRATPHVVLQPLTCSVRLLQEITSILGIRHTLKAKEGLFILIISPSYGGDLG